MKVGPFINGYMGGLIFKFFVEQLSRYQIIIEEYTYRLETSDLHR